jgi:uncharacterized membrane protein
MPIEFPCRSCGSPQSRAEHTAGQPGRCESCGASWVIPYRSQPLAPTVNPYAATESTIAVTAQVRPPLRPTLIAVGDVWDRSWRLFQQQFVPLVRLTCTYTLLFLVPFGFVIAIEMYLQQSGAAPSLQHLVQFAILPFSSAFGVFISVGWTRVMLAVARGQPIQFAQMFDAGDVFWRLYGFNLLFGLAGTAVPLVANSLAYEVPVISLGLQMPYHVGMALFWLIYGQYLYLVADRNFKLGESLNASRIITRGNRVTVFLVMLLSVALVVAGFMFCFAGALFTVPLAGLLQVVAYLLMTGEETA